MKDKKYVETQVEFFIIHNQWNLNIIYLQVLFTLHQKFETCLSRNVSYSDDLIEVS